ncbi:MAG: GGDEF domain-containing protein [Porticoccaceae bacterium]|nr:GGDEF domain-containing protein [Porticoccaceae bacterium]
MNTEKTNILITVACMMLIAILIRFSLDAYRRSFLEKRLESELTRLANSVDEQMGLSPAKLKHREDLRQQAMHDSLTGLYNRRYLSESMEMALNLAKRHSPGLTVVMLDVDHFKRFNDTFDHQAW